MTEQFRFNTPDELFNYLKEHPVETQDIKVELPVYDMPDLPVVDKLVIAQVLAAIAVILGVDLSQEQVAAIALIVSAVGSLLLWADARRRGSRNERLAHEHCALIDLTARYTEAAGEGGE